MEEAVEKIEEAVKGVEEATQGKEETEIFDTTLEKREETASEVYEE